MKCRYTIGKVIGAGSFGVVREAVHKRTNVHYACKTIPKLPKKGRGTPRYLLKIQTEVDAMLQLGPSLDAVFLQARFLASQSGLVQLGIVLPVLQQHLMADSMLLHLASNAIRIIVWTGCFEAAYDVGSWGTMFLCAECFALAFKVALS